MAMQAADLPDLLETTRIKTRKANFTLLDKRRSEFVAYPTFFRKSMMTWAGGHTYEFKAMTAIPDSATWTGVWDEDVVKRQNVWTKGRVYMRHLKNHYVYDELERLMNKGEDQIIDEIEALKFQCMMGIAHLMEEVIVTGPDDSTDDLKPNGFKTLLTTNASTEGFDKSNVSGFPSGRMEIDSTNPKYSGWANWCGHYSNYTYDDLVEAMIRGSEKTRFKLPISNANVINPSQAQLKWYCNLETKLGLAKSTREQNDQVGPDLGRYYDTFLIRGAPVQYLPVLDDESDNPIYGINHSTIKSVSLRGNVFRESPGMTLQSNHNARVFWVDCSWNMYVDDLSRNQTYVKV